MERQVNNLVGKFLATNNILPEKVSKITLLAENTKEATRLIQLTNGKNFLLSTTNYHGAPIFGIKLSKDTSWFTFNESHTKDFLTFINEAEPATTQTTPAPAATTTEQPAAKEPVSDPEQTKKAEAIVKEEKYFTYLNTSLFPTIAKDLGTDINNILIFVEGQDQNIIDFFSKQLGLKSKKTQLQLPKGSEDFKDQIEPPLLFDYNGIKFIAFSKLNYLELTQNQPKKAVIVSSDDYQRILDIDTDTLK